MAYKISNVMSFAREMNTSPRLPANRLSLSVVATVVGVTSVCVCCLGFILGAVAIIFATQSSSRYRKEDYVGAESSSQVAFVLSIISLIVSFISMIFLLLTIHLNGLSGVEEMVKEGLGGVVMDRLY